MSGCENELIMVSDYLRLIYEELVDIHRTMFFALVMLFCIEIIIVTKR